MLSSLFDVMSRGHKKEVPGLDHQNGENYNGQAVGKGAVSGQRRTESAKQRNSILAAVPCNKTNSHFFDSLLNKQLVLLWSKQSPLEEWLKILGKSKILQDARAIESSSASRQRWTVVKLRGLLPEEPGDHHLLVVAPLSQMKTRLIGPSHGIAETPVAHRNDPKTGKSETHIVFPASSRTLILCQKDDPPLPPPLRNLHRRHGPQTLLRSTEREMRASSVPWPTALLSLFARNPDPPW
jgi:hypothetical protein